MQYILPLLGPCIFLTLLKLKHCGAKKYYLTLVNTLTMWMIFVTRLTRQVLLVEQKLLTFPERLSSPPVFSGVRVTRSLVLCVCFVDRCLSFCTFSFGHCIVYSSSIYGFWLPLWYLQTLLTGPLQYLPDTG